MIETFADRHDDIFVGHSDMAQMMREHDWAATALGPPAEWSSALKGAVRLLLTSRFEMWLGWGDEINFLYNDAYRPTLGDKHPHALGVPTKILWAEIWEDIRDRLAAVYERGEASWDQGLLLILERAGFPEETYHTFSYSPLIDDNGQVGGVFCAVTEDTARILAQRRMETLRNLGAALTAAGAKSAVLTAVEQELSANTYDLPFALTYLFDDDGNAELAAVSGIAAGARWAPRKLSLDNAIWELAPIWEGDESFAVDVSGRDDLPTGAWDRPPLTARIKPLIHQGASRPYGALIVALNPLRPFDEDYAGFLKLLTAQIAAAIAGADAYDSERRRAADLAEASRLRQEAAEALEIANAQLTSEVELRTEEGDRLRTLFQQAPSFMAILSGRDHVFELVNDAYLQLVGHRDLLGLPVAKALPEVATQGYVEILNGVMETGVPYIGRNLPVQLQRTAEGPLELRYVHLIYQPLFDRTGRPTGIFVDGYDVTHQKRTSDQLGLLNETLEQRVTQRTDELRDALAKLEAEIVERQAAEAQLRQSQKIEALGKLTGGVAHDFNNLLQVISGNLQLLSKDIAGSPQAERRVKNALAGVSRGAKLASQLLAFGRRSPLAPKVINLGRLIKDMDDLLRRTLGEDIEIETIVGGGLWNTLVDPHQIENAILNLAINARDAMPFGGQLTIETSNASLDDAYVLQHEDLKSGQYVLVAVTDNGSGIPNDVLESVFEPFFSTKREGKGTGLGLSMVHGLVKQSGGHIKIYSEAGEGTTVKFYLPRAMAEVDIVVEDPATPVSGGTETVLVVEDDDDVRETAVGLLTELGYRVLKARDAQSALVIVDSGIPIDLIFTDVVMPGPVRSPELARKAKERLPDVAVLFTSGYTENAIVHHGRLDPGVELLSKPYAREALARKVRHVLRNEAQRQIAGKTRPATPPSQSATRLKVLLVEDDELIRASTSELLVDLGHIVLEASDGATAMIELGNALVDVLLVDVGLPDMSGIELARQALLARPALLVIFASGDDTAARASGVSFAALLPKPYSPQDLDRALNQVSLTA